jgi:hypothetical protein
LVFAPPLVLAPPLPTWPATLGEPPFALRPDVPSLAPPSP